MNIRLGLTAQATGTVDVITATFSPAPTLIDRATLFLRALGANTTETPTFSPNGLTAHTITKFGGQPLTAGDILGANHVLILQYDLTNTRWELLNPAKHYSIYFSDGTDDGGVEVDENKTNAFHSKEIQLDAPLIRVVGGKIRSENEKSRIRIDDAFLGLSYEDGTNVSKVNNYIDAVQISQTDGVEQSDVLVYKDKIEVLTPSITKNGDELATEVMVHATVQSNIKIIGDWDATSGSYPLADESNTTPFIAQWGATIKAGWAFRVGYGQAGTVDGFDYENGDVVYALIDNPTDDSADWGDLDHNLQQASESLRGTAKIVTNAIIDDETTTDNERIVSSFKLWGRFVPKFLSLAWSWIGVQNFINGIKTTLLSNDDGEFLFKKTVNGTILIWTNGQNLKLSARSGGAPQIEIDKTTGKAIFHEETASKFAMFNATKGLESSTYGEVDFDAKLNKTDALTLGKAKQIGRNF